MKRFGTLLTFKPGTTKKQAEAALETIREMDDVFSDQWISVAGRPRVSPRVEQFDDDHGSPVFYLP